MDKIRWVLVLAMTLWFVPASFAEEAFLDPEESARRSHETAMSDVIYEQENFKALYYQNLQIIQLLKEIRDEIHALNVRDAKEDQGS